MEPTLKSIRIKDDRPRAKRHDHLCADRGYDYPFIREMAVRFGYRPHIRSRGDEQRAKRLRRGRARRWVVEACHSWLNRFRKVLVRFEKTELAALGLLELACGIICWRRAIYV